MDRTFELSACGNNRGYRVVLRICDKEFSCRGRCTTPTMDAYNQIANAVERVYGADLYEHANNADIVDALVCVEDIIRSFHGITSRRTQQMKTEDAIEIIESMIDGQEKYEECALMDDPVDEELLHEIEVELEALKMAKRALERG